MFKSGRLPSVMGRGMHSFSRSPQANIPRSTFDRSHGYKSTFDAGYLIPVFVDEALPGDTFNLNMQAFARLATPLFPIMDNLYLDSFFFAVPYRLVWDNWEKFNGFQENPGDSTDYLIPQVVAPSDPGWDIGSIYDYMGIPTYIKELSVSAFHLRAYNLIWNEWFRDENLQDSVPVPKDDGPDNQSDYVLLRRGKRYDYFTSCLPWPQKGPAVDLPLGTTAPVLRTDNAAAWSGYVAGGNTRPSITNALGTEVTTGLLKSASGSGVGMSLDPEGGLYTDLSAATAATINSLRQAFQTQKLYERDARGGTRYTEIIRSHFGVVSPDARLQRPEYLGGGSTPVIISPVAQTSSTDGTSPLANLAAIGTSGLHGHRFVKSFTEHCLILGFVSARADLNYQAGLNRMWSRSTRFDFYWPALSHIGEQAVLTKEISAQGPLTIPFTDDDVFGYQERYAEYRYKPSVITSTFRSNAPSSLDAWHLAQDFNVVPVLNDEFIVENPPMDRIKAVTSQPDFLFDSWFSLKCARPMPVYSVPGLVDHF